MGNPDKIGRRPPLESRFTNRRKRLLGLIKGEAAIFCSAPAQHKSRDAEHSYAPNTDLFYLTGIDEQDCVLVLLGSSKGPRTILYLRDRDPLVEQWRGEVIGLKRAKKRFNVDEVRQIASFRSDLPALLADAQTLHFSGGVDPLLDDLIFKQFFSALGPRHNFPGAIRDARILTAEMRFVKDRDEIRAMRHAADITAHSLEWLAAQLPGCTSELHAARLLETEFARLGAGGLAFETIVASGRNAVCLHHHPTLQPLWKQELVLVDCGAAFGGYSADITRTFPLSGKFTSPQADLYDAVQRTLTGCIGKAKPGATLAELHQHSIQLLTQALVDLKLLRGPLDQLISQGRYKRFYMHRIGHWLGLDTHDISPVAGGRAGADGHPSHHRPFVPGNIFTVEPGLYIDSKDESVPRHFRGIGIRLEDDVLITDGGCEVISNKIPSDRQKIEQMLHG